MKVQIPVRKSLKAQGEGVNDVRSAYAELGIQARSASECVCPNLRTAKYVWFAARSSAGGR